MWRIWRKQKNWLNSSGKSRKTSSQILARPFNLALKKKTIIPDLVTPGWIPLVFASRSCTYTVSSPSFTFPLAAPSANPFGYISPTRPEHVNEQLGDKIKYILDGGECRVGIESTIVGFENDIPVSIPAWWT